MKTWSHINTIYHSRKSKLWKAFRSYENINIKVYVILIWLLWAKYMTNFFIVSVK